MSEALRAALGLIRTLTLPPGDVTARDVDAARRAGLSDDDILDVVQICAAFNIIDRVADAMAFSVPPEEHLQLGAQVIKRVGYRLPAVIGRVTPERRGVSGRRRAVRG